MSDRERVIERRTEPEAGNGASQLVRFLIVGCSNFAVSYSVFYLSLEYLEVGSVLLRALGGLGESLESWLASHGISTINGLVSQVFSYSAGIANSFLWNSLWTFRVTSPGAGHALRFVALNLANLIASAIAIFVFVDLMGFNVTIVWLVVMALVTIANFTGSKYWAFARREARGVEAEAEAER